MWAKCTDLITDTDTGSTELNDRTDYSREVVWKRQPRTESQRGHYFWGHISEAISNQWNRNTEKENKIKWSHRFQNNVFHESGFLYQKQGGSEGRQEPVRLRGLSQGATTELSARAAQCSAVCRRQLAGAQQWAGRGGERCDYKACILCSNTIIHLSHAHKETFVPLYPFMASTFFLRFEGSNY